MTYAARLQTLPTVKSLAAQPHTHRAIWLSGQSSYAHSHLMPEQRQTLKPLREFGYDVLDAGFPYHPAYLQVPWQREALLSASWRNARQTTATLISPRHGASLARHLQPVLDHTSERLLVVAGSSGLLHWLAALRSIRLPPQLRILVVALGPAPARDPREPRGPRDPRGTRGTRGHRHTPWARGSDQLSLQVVLGRRDWIARTLYAGHVDEWVEGAHMDYASDPQVAQLIAGWGQEHAG